MNICEMETKIYPIATGAWWLGAQALSQVAGFESQFYHPQVDAFINFYYSSIIWQMGITLSLTSAVSCCISVVCYELCHYTDFMLLPAVRVRWDGQAGLILTPLSVPLWSRVSSLNTTLFICIPPGNEIDIIP